MFPSCLSLYSFYKYIRRVVAQEPTNEAATRGRESRQQGGDTYTLGIAFPAVKYVPMHNYMQPSACLLAFKLNGLLFLFNLFQWMDSLCPNPVSNQFSTFGTVFFFCMHCIIYYHLNVSYLRIRVSVLDWYNLISFLSFFLVFWDFTTVDLLIFTSALRLLLFICTFF